MTARQDLKRLLEFGTLSLGIEGELAMWRALTEVTRSHPVLPPPTLATLAKRAETQRANLKERRIQIVSQALTR